MQDESWHLEIGDPTLVGWVTVAAYAVAAWYCWFLAFACKREHSRPAQRKNHLFWLVLALFVTFLGINKQLDLQSLLRLVGRSVATHQGWYEQRRPVQAIFFALLALLGLAGGAFLVWLIQGSIREKRVILFGIFLLGCFVVVRAASAEHVDAIFGRNLDDETINASLELAGIFFVTLGAHQARVRLRETAANEAPPVEQAPAK